MRSKCIPFILLLIITIGLASCGKAAGTSSSASPENDESFSLSSTAEVSSLSVSEQSPGQSSAADSTVDSTVPSSEANADSSKPADPLSDPDAGTGSEMDHKASRTRPEHTVDDLVYNPPAPQAPASWTAPASQTTNPSDSNSKKQKDKQKEKKEKSKKRNRIGSSMGGGGF